MEQAARDLEARRWSEGRSAKRLSAKQNGGPAQESYMAKLNGPAFGLRYRLSAVCASWNGGRGGGQAQGDKIEIAASDVCAPHTV